MKSNLNIMLTEKPYQSNNIVETQPIQILEVRFKVFLLRDIPQEEALIRIAGCIDRVLLKEEKWKEFHSTNQFKNYVFCAPYPLAEHGFYQKHKIYQIIIRTVDFNLAQYLSIQLPQYEDDYLKGLICEHNIIPRRTITSLYTLTPLIIKSDRNKYWRDNMSFEDFEEQIKINLIKKYKAYTNQNVDEAFPFHSFLELKNKVPIKIPYKRIHLLADKVQLQITDYPMAQELAYFAQGVGIGTMGSRGYGFVNAIYQKGRR